MIQTPHFILYVSDQRVSRDFYTYVLSVNPELDVPGMTEFNLGSCKIGLMPEKSIQKILGNTTPDCSTANGIPRCELYLLVDNTQAYLDRAIDCGAILVSEYSLRDWGHTAAYVLDFDGHVIAFAKE